MIDLFAPRTVTWVWNGVPVVRHSATEVDFAAHYPESDRASIIEVKAWPRGIPGTEKFAPIIGDTSLTLSAAAAVTQVLRKAELVTYTTLAELLYEIMAPVVLAANTSPHPREPARAPTRLLEDGNAQTAAIRRLPHSTLPRAAIRGHSQVPTPSELQPDLDAIAA